MVFNSVKKCNSRTVTTHSNHGDSNKKNDGISSPVTAPSNDGPVSSTASSVKQTIRHL